jgi:uncharacterized membrane protein YeaQ/YmgE (transglycosylase-associated protein family)
MGWIYTIVIGLIVGLIARLIKPGKDAMGWILTILLGIGGAFIAGLIGQVLGFYRPGQPAGFIASVLGAILLLVIFGAINKKKS